MTVNIVKLIKIMFEFVDLFHLFCIMKVKGLKRRIKSKYKTIARFAREHGRDPMEVHNLLKRAEKNKGINQTRDNLEALIKELEDSI